MKKIFAIVSILSLVIMTGCFTVKKNDTYVRSPSKELAKQALEPSPGWSVTDGAVQKNPGASVHYRNGNEEFDYYPPSQADGSSAEGLQR